ncbi:unnamed protein product, partial [marine sediment metagenome]
ARGERKEATQQFIEELGEEEAFSLAQVSGVKMGGTLCFC